VLGARQRVVQPDRPAEVVDDERDALEAEVVDQGLQPPGVGGGPVVGRQRLVGEAEAEVVRRDDAVAPAERADRVPPEERPRGGAVDEDDGLARALVDVAHGVPVDLEAARLERVEGGGDPGVDHGWLLADAAVKTLPTASGGGVSGSAVRWWFAPAVRADS